MPAGFGGMAGGLVSMSWGFAGVRALRSAIRGTQSEVFLSGFSGIHTGGEGVGQALSPGIGSHRLLPYIATLGLSMVSRKALAPQLLAPCLWYSSNLSMISTVTALGPGVAQT